jgi:small subunit ribosomal protein S20
VIGVPEVKRKNVAAKRTKQSIKSHEKNVAVKSEIKTVFKRAVDAVEQGKSESKELIHAAVVSIDKAASKGIVHKNKAARKKSRLMKKTKKVVAAPAKK